MSWNRENVVWKSINGKWNIGFYDYYSSPPYDDEEEYDPEWDVTYQDNFHWVSTGHATSEDAIRSWVGANPGSHTIVDDDYAEVWGKDGPTYKQLAEQFDNEAAKAWEESREGRAFYKGPKIERSPYFLAKEILELPSNEDKLKKQHLERLLNDKDDEYKSDFAERIQKDLVKWQARNEEREQIRLKSERARRENFRFRDTVTFNVPSPYSEQKRREEEKEKREKEIKEQAATLAYYQKLIKDNKVVQVQTKASPDSQSIATSNGTDKKAPDVSTGSKTTPKNDQKSKWHINANGDVKPCKASQRACRYGGEQSHYPTQKAAQKAYEDRQKGSF